MMKLLPDMVESLRQELKKPLPGELARHRMAPSYRPQLSMEEIRKQNPKVGGVLLLLFEKEGQPHLVLTERKKYDGVHSGQMSFPGGKKDGEDANMIQTALRETEEEIGVKRQQIEVIGCLSELYIPPSNFLVYPTVGFTENIVFRPQEQEVETIVEIPVAFFMDEANVRMNTEIKLYNGTGVKVPAYVYQSHIIWGATAIILSEFIYILKQIKGFS